MTATCQTCNLPRCTATDLERWHSEFGDKPAADPPWAKAICWTKDGFQCTRPPKVAR